MTDTQPCESPGRSPAEPPLLSVEDLHVTFRKGNTAVQAVAGISFALRQGETLGLVGESGCGKSTTGRAVVQVERATSGKIRFGDTEITSVSRGDLRKLRTQLQMIFQDPISSLNPRRKVTDIVAEPLTIWRIGSKAERRETANAMLDRVGIDPYINGNRRRPASSPAASASASASPVPWCSSPSCWSATRSSPRWTSRCRRRSSTSSRTSRRSTT